MADFSPVVVESDGLGWRELGPASTDTLATAKLSVGTQLVVPSGASFPGSPVAKEIFWRTDEQKLYRRNNANTAWEAPKPIDIGSTAPTSPYDGQQWYDNSSGERTLYIYDASRSKWLSSSEWTLQWGHDNADGELLRGSGVNTPGTGTGVRIPKDCTIVRISGQQRSGAATKQFDVLVNGTSVLNFDLTSDVYTSNIVDEDLDADDYVRVEVESAGLGAQDVAITLWFAWRG